MDAIVILGSRNPDGQTARAAQAWAQGIADAGGAAEFFYLPQMRIERCRQCDNEGWGLCRTEGRCVIGDDFDGLVARMGKADVVCFATPVYYSDLAESLRAFLDRLRRTAQFSAAGKEPIAGKAAYGICVAGGGGGGAAACCTSLDKILRTCGFDVVDTEPVRRQNLDLKLQTLRTTGHWAARQPAGD